MTKSNSLVICLLDDDPSALQARVRFLASAGWQVKPFTDPNPFLEYARIHHPEAAIISFGELHASGLEIRARLREVSPVTSVINLLKVHYGRAQRVLSGNELVNLIEQQCIATSTQFHFNSRSSSANSEVDLGCRV